MANRFEQSTPPSIHDVYRGLPIGPGGVEPFIYRDRGRHGRRPVSLPWRPIMLAIRHAMSRIRDILGPDRAGALSHTHECMCHQRTSGTFS